MSRKIVTVWICLMITIGVSIIVVELVPKVEAPSILYVGSGLGNDSATIQGGINIAKDGDIVFVYNGIYYENVIVNKTINLTGEDKDSTIIDGSANGDVVRVTRDWVNISGFTITNCGGGGAFDAGLRIESNYNIISNNKINNNNRHGIILYSLSNSIINNSISGNNNNGIYFYSSSKNNITGNDVSNNGYGLFFFKSSNSNNISYNEIKLNSADGIFIYSTSIKNEINCNNLTSNGDDGIELEGVYYNNVINNSFLSNSVTGINLDGAPLNYIYKNKFQSTGNGIFLSHSSRNNITNNYFTNNGFGLYLTSSSDYNNITINNVTENSQGIYISYSTENQISNNIFSTNTFKGIYFLHTNHNNVTKNEILNNEQGIYFSGTCEYNIIKGNDISDNVRGIYFWDSPNKNKVINNNVSNNTEYGFRLFDANGNKIYHNKIISNAIQAFDNQANNDWDDGYPLGGNYWSDYSGVDTFKGPDQNIPGSDGIGDSNYTIDLDSIDNYPLMEPYPGLGIILNCGWNLISIPRIQSNISLNSVLASLDGEYDAVQLYNITDVTDHWKHLHISKPSELNDLNEINHIVGFWIHVTNPNGTIFRYDGSLPTQDQSIPLFSGWNLVGFPSLTNKNRTEGLNNLTFGSDVDAIWTYNAAAQRWKKLGESDYFEVGRGYWMHSKVTKTWIVPL